MKKELYHITGFRMAGACMSCKKTSSNLEEISDEDGYCMLLCKKCLKEFKNNEFN